MLVLVLFQAHFQVLTFKTGPRTSTSFEARTQLAWHKKLPFNGEHLKLMGQVRVFELGWATVIYESQGNVQYVKVTARLRGIRKTRSRNDFCKDFQAVFLHFASIKFPLHSSILFCTLPYPESALSWISRTLSLAQSSSVHLGAVWGSPWEHRFSPSALRQLFDYLRVIESWADLDGGGIFEAKVNYTGGDHVQFVFCTWASAIYEGKKEIAFSGWKHVLVRKSRLCLGTR